MEVQELATLIQTGLEDLATRIDRVDQRVAKVEDQVHGARIEVEAVRHNTDLLADGIENLNEKLDRHATENNTQFDELRGILRLT